MTGWLQLCHLLKRSLITVFVSYLMNIHSPTVTSWIGLYSCAEISVHVLGFYFYLFIYSYKVLNQWKQLYCIDCRCRRHYHPRHHHNLFNSEKWYQPTSTVLLMRISGRSKGNRSYSRKIKQKYIGYNILFCYLIQKELRRDVNKMQLWCRLDFRRCCIGFGPSFLHFRLYNNS